MDPGDDWVMLGKKGRKGRKCGKSGSRVAKSYTSNQQVSTLSSLNNSSFPVEVCPDLKMQSLNSNLVNLFSVKPKSLSWIIDFTSSDTNFISPNFGQPPSFRLRLYRNIEMKSAGNSICDYDGSAFKNCAILLDHFESGQKVCVSTRISIMNSKREKCNTQEGRVNFDGCKTLSGGVFHFDFDQFIIKGKLTIFCEVYVIDGKCISSGFNGDSLIAVSNDQKTLLESGMFADVMITVDDGKEFKAHKNILASRSPVFAAMFEHTDTKDAQDGRIEIEYVQSDVFEQFLQYLYTGKATSLEQYTEELLTIAEKYQVDRLKSVCVQQLCSTLTTESLGKLLHLADLYRSDELKGKCVQFIKYYAKDINFEQLKSTIDCSFEFLFEIFHLSLT